MFGKLEVHVLEVVWRFEPITFYIKELRVKHLVCYFYPGDLCIACSNLGWAKRTFASSDSSCHVDPDVTGG